MTSEKVIVKMVCIVSSQRFQRENSSRALSICLQRHTFHLEKQSQGPSQRFLVSWCSLTRRLMWPPHCLINPELMQAKGELTFHHSKVAGIAGNQRPLSITESASIILELRASSKQPAVNCKCCACARPGVRAWCVHVRQWSWQRRVPK